MSETKQPVSKPEPAPAPSGQTAEEFAKQKLGWIPDRPEIQTATLTTAFNLAELYATARTQALAAENEKLKQDVLDARYKSTWLHGCYVCGKQATGNERHCYMFCDEHRDNLQALAERVKELEVKWSELLLIGVSKVTRHKGHSEWKNQRAEKAEAALAQSLTPSQQAAAAEEIAQLGWHKNYGSRAEVLAIMQKHAGRKG